ncbi:unnamed protein product [Closterium sp. Naga37s-1]|nr:unnamed protein product [Closterium sp. Naga37s-1]
MSKLASPSIRKLAAATCRPAAVAVDTHSRRLHSAPVLPTSYCPALPPPPDTSRCAASSASRANASTARARIPPLDCAPAVLRSAALSPLAWGEKDEGARRQVRGGGRIVEWRGAEQCGRGDGEWQREVGAVGRRSALAAGAGVAVGAWGSACVAGGQREGLAEGVLGPLPETIHASIDAQRMDPHGRIIIVGDVHGCHAELEALMERCERKDGDVVILVGDMVNKGPDSHAVLRMARRMGAVAVRGNHDDKALAVAAAAAAGKSKRWRNTKWPSDLSSTDLDWLLSLPFSIRIPSHNCLVVHAGLVPGSGLSEWDAHDWLVSGGDSSGGEGEEANGWARGWGWEACKAADEGAVLWSHEWRGREHVVFGHDALRGLQRTPWATGLDTGCVYGGRLTACVLPSLAQLQQLTHARAAEQRKEGHKGAVRVWPMLQIVSVAAQRQYAVPKVKGRK